MTLPQILAAVCERKKMARQTLYRYFEALNIKRVGPRQRPAHYPDDSADRILEHLGLPHVVTMPQLRNARRTARRGR